MKMTTEQFAVWTNAVHDVGEYYNDLIYFLDCIDSADINLHYRLQYGKQWIDDTFPEFRQDKRRFVRVWLGDEPIEVEG